MSALKCKMEILAELFQKDHPGFSYEEAFEYVMDHHSLEYWENYPKHVDASHNSVKQIITNHYSDADTARMAAVEIGEALKFNMDHLCSNVIIQQKHTEVSIVIFDRCIGLKEITMKIY